MTMQSQYSMRSPAVKRLMKEMVELREATEDFYTQPIDDNLFEWHFTVRGPEDSEFEDGYYHGRIILPPEYPMKPPSIILLTPNGRFELNKKICLSISGYHPESWQPSWSIRTALLAIIGFMPTHGNGAIGSLDYTPEERKILAKKSQEWSCQTCGKIKDLLKKRTKGATKSDAAEEAKKLASQISFKGEEQKNKERANSTESDSKYNNDSIEPEAMSPEQPETSSRTGPEVQPTPSPDLRQRTPRPRPRIRMEINDSESQSRRESIVAIVILSVAIAVLLLRRVMLSYFQTFI